MIERGEEGRSGRGLRWMEREEREGEGETGGRRVGCLEGMREEGVKASMAVWGKRVGSHLRVHSGSPLAQLWLPPGCLHPS